MAIRRRSLIGGFANEKINGTYWSIGSSGRDRAGVPSYAPSLVDEVISTIRTDLDACSAAEIAVLENHGSLVADRAMQGRMPHLIAHDAALRVPFPEWLADEERLRAALRGSAKRTLFGRW
jgi:hypothetical protein